MRFMLQPNHILFASLVGWANERQRRIIEFQSRTRPLTITVSPCSSRAEVDVTLFDLNNVAFTVGLRPQIG